MKYLISILFVIGCTASELQTEVVIVASNIIDAVEQAENIDTSNVGTVRLLMQNEEPIEITKFIEVFNGTGIDYLRFGSCSYSTQDWSFKPTYDITVNNIIVIENGTMEIQPSDVSFVGFGSFQETEYPLGNGQFCTADFVVN